MDDPLPRQRLETEISLLEAMYPDQIIFTTQRSELKYIDHQTHAAMVLRLPSSYPEAGLPEVISATDGKADARTRLKAAVDEMGLVQGEEVLDAVFRAFEGLLASQRLQDDDDSTDAGPGTGDVMSEEAGQELQKKPGRKTVVIWLHHLLNTNKRKLALNPPQGSAAADNSDAGTAVSGITKPGYPGILVYSGPGTAVDVHVAELKAQRWQAFQVRLEEMIGWEFGHGRGVREVESMADVVTGIVGEEQREVFLKAAGIK